MMYPVKLHICAAFAFAGFLNAQSSPQELATAISQRWISGSTEEFASLYPFREAQSIHAGFVKSKTDRVAGLSNVIQSDKSKAVLVLSGIPLTGNSGDDTIYGMAFSGLYEAVPDNGRWRLERQIPLDTQAQILFHHLKVVVRPGSGLDIEDRMRVHVGTSNGFTARLNPRAKLLSAKAGNADVPHHVGGGLLWAGLPKGNTELTIRFSLDPESCLPGANSGCFTKDFGHLRNQYFWHPFFGFSNTGDQAEFEIEVRMPKEYGLTTSIPQTERVESAERIVQARSIQTSFALTLAYDREWNVTREKSGGIQLQLFATPSFRPEPASIKREFLQVHSLLSSRFGEPKSGYMAVVQLRGDPGNYWHFNSNQAVFAAGSPGFFSSTDKNPGANLAHEIGHFWTQGSGPIANFLREGWATYVESLVLEHEFGHEVAERFWKHHARNYFEHYDGKLAIWDSGNQSNLNYDKGVWIFRMLEQSVGSSGFQKAMAEFSKSSLAGAADWETFVECLQKQQVPDFDARQFLLPWLKEKRAPDLKTLVEEDKVTIIQTGPLFALPITLEVTMTNGTRRKRVWIKESKTVVQFDGPVSKVTIDPDQVLLLPR